jgi:choline dehydrogenase
VILSAGSIGSTLLLLSGVGGRDLLQRAAVELDRPGVGQNLQDHLQRADPVSGVRR